MRVKRQPGHEHRDLPGVSMICEGRGQLVGDRVVKRKNLVLDERCVKNVNSGRPGQRISMAETLICKGCKAPKKIAECHKKLRSHRDSLANLASKHRTSFFREEDQGPAMRIAELLYREARANDWMVSPRTLVYLAMEARATMPDFAIAVIDLYLTMAMWKEEIAWACCMRGEIHESRQEYPLASEWYERALAEHPGSKAAFRLCRSRFHEQKWQEAVEAYRMGIENKDVLQIIDNGTGFENMSKILVASALDKLDRRDEAMVMCEEALKAFPQNPALITMHEQFKARI